jgi:hypothetical protein
MYDVGISSNLDAAAVAPTSCAPIATAATISSITAATTANTAAATFMTRIPAAEASAAATTAAISTVTTAAELLEKIGDFAAGLDQHFVEGTGDVGVLLVDEGGGTALRKRKTKEVC